MDALGSTFRSQVASALEWAVAALFLTATIAVASLLVRDMRREPQRFIATESARPVATEVATVPPWVPERAISVPVLPLADGKEIRIGDTVWGVAAQLGRAAESGRQEVDRGALGERLTRFYDYAGSRFILVFEPFERNGEARLAAIYLPDQK
jgi:hypothetical protein